MILEDKIKILKDLGFGDRCYIESLNGYTYQLFSGFTHDGCHNTEPAIINYFPDSREKGFYYNNPLFEYLISECNLKTETTSIFRQLRRFLKVPLKLSLINDKYWFVILDDLKDILFTNNCISEMKKVIAILDFYLQKAYKKYLRYKKIEKTN